jgi:hypothetical protein
LTERPDRYSPTRRVVMMKNGFRHSEGTARVGEREDSKFTFVTKVVK